MSPCLGEDTIIDFVEHRLDGASAQRFEQHLASCAACRRLVSETARAELAVTRAAPLYSVPPPPPEPAVLARGTAIGRYMVVSLLGRGGMGVVYRAYDPDLNRQVAVKLVGLGLFESGVRDHARQRLLREAQALAKLSHPNVVVVHDVGTIGDDVFIAMELVEGSTLRAWLREAPRTPREILRVFRYAGEGLAAAHEVGVVHRDFKPDNVMVGRDGRVRVLDFGLARFGPAQRASRRSLPSLGGSPELTNAGAMLGTPAYMSPEQDAGLEAGAPSDQFSFCVALYEALFAAYPYRGDSYDEVARGRAVGEIALPPKLRGVPSQIRRAVLVGLRADPAERHPSLRALLDELRPPRWSSPRRIALVALAALALGGGAAWLLLRSTSADPAAAACAFVDDDVAQLWNPQRRDKLVAEMSRANPQNAAIAKEIAHDVDSWTAGWATARRELCARALASASEPSKEQRSAEQLQCLERLRTQLDALVTVFATSDPALVARSREAIGNVRPASECKDVQSQGVSERDKQTAMPIMRQILQSRMAQNAAKLEEALTLATAAVDTARALGSPAIAVALQTLGDAQAVNGDITHARASYRAAAVASAEIHEDGMVADAWLALVQLSFRDHNVDATVEEALFAARLATTRLGEDSERRPLYHYVAGTVHVLRGELDPAIAELEQAIAGWDRLDAKQYAGNMAPARNSLGLAYAERGAWDAANRNLEQALAGMRSFGPDIPQVGTVLANQAVVAGYQEHFDEAEALMHQAIAIYSKLRPEHPLVAEGHINLGLVYAESGRCALARPLLDKARAEFERLQSPGLAMALLEQARCTKDPRAALALLDRAHTIATAHSPSPRALAEIELSQAMTLDRMRGGDRSRAIALAVQARGRFVAIGAGSAPRVRRLDAWVAARSR